ncbi:MAG: MarR family winged helix-turn-helix transcriptional regulator [Jiangellaceae bacterium]
MTRWLTAEQQQAWRRFVAVTMLLPYEIDAQLQRDAGLSHVGYWVLAMLSEAPGRALRMSELAARTTASPSRISHVVTRLEGLGWIRRDRSSDDRRGMVAMLTDAGYAKVVECAPGHVETVQQFVFDALTDDQVRQLDRISAALLAQLDPDSSRAWVEAHPPE